MAAVPARHRPALRLEAWYTDIIGHFSIEIAAFSVLFSITEAVISIEILSNPLAGLRDCFWATATKAIIAMHWPSVVGTANCNLNADFSIVFYRKCRNEGELTQKK